MLKTSVLALTVGTFLLAGSALAAAPASVDVKTSTKPTAMASSTTTKSTTRHHRHHRRTAKKSAGTSSTGAHKG